MNFMLISTISRLQRHFRRNWPYIQPASQPQTTCNHTIPGPPHPASSPPRSSETSHKLLQQSVCINKAFLHKMSETVSGKLICMLIVLIGVSICLQFIIVTDLSGQMLTFDGVWHFGEVFSSRLNPGFHRTSVWPCVGERIADFNVVDRVAHASGGLMVWAGVCYGQRTRVHFIDGILNAQRYSDEILRLIVVPFIHDHHLILQHHNAWPHVARTCTQFL